MVSGGVSDPLLGAEVAARIEPWIAMVERKLEQLLAGTPVRALASPRDLAFGLVSLYFGVDMLSHMQRDRARAESLLDLATRLSALVETFLPSIPGGRAVSRRHATRSGDRSVQLLREHRSPSGCWNPDARVRTLTYHPDRPHPLASQRRARVYRFDDPAALARSLEGVSTLYNTFWVRFDHGKTSFANAIEYSRMLFFAARRAGVQRIVHLSITNPSIESPLPYFRGKALVEYALAQSGVPYSIVRPTWIFGGERDVLANNIAWILRRMPAFALPGNGTYPVQPVHVDDLARICIDAGGASGDMVIDAAGPETMAFRDLVALVRAAVDANSPIVRIPPALMAAAARALGSSLATSCSPRRDPRPDGRPAVSHEPPLGQIAFSHWLERARHIVGRAYANELQRHFAATTASA